MSYARESSMSSQLPARAHGAPRAQVILNWLALLALLALVIV
jgi:hypothetical protein